MNAKPISRKIPRAASAGRIPSTTSLVNRSPDHAPQREETFQNMRGLGRYVQVLHLFSERHSQWTIPDMAATVVVPASTVYRTVQDLVAANFLEAAGDGLYRLGASVIELDRYIRLTDPLYKIGTPLLQDVARQARVPCVAVLARLYNDTVMCVSQALAPNSDEIHTSYERGRPQPLARGATSKVILAQIPARRLKRLITSGKINGDHTLGIQEELVAIREQGYCITKGEVDVGLMGVAAPVLAKGKTLIGSLSLVLRQSDVDAQQLRRLTLLVPSSARLLSEELSAHYSLII